MEDTQVHIDWKYSSKPDVMFGTGVAANSLNSFKRFYHAPLRPEENGSTPSLPRYFWNDELGIRVDLVCRTDSCHDCLLRIPLYVRRPEAM